MEETNITTYEGIEEEPEMTELSEEISEDSGLSTGVAMLIGSGLTLAGIAGWKALKKLWAKHKAKKEQTEKPIEAIEVNDAEENE